MAEQVIVCPHCKKEIALTEAITQKIQEDLRKAFEVESKRKEEEFIKREKVILAKENEISRSRELMEQEISKRVMIEKERFKNEIKKKISEESGLELKALQDEKDSLTKRLEEAQKSELQLRRNAREVEERQKNIDLEVARKIDADRAKIREEAISKADVEHLLKDREYEKKISDLIKQLEDAKRKAEQGSQQTQGEVLELELEDMLKQAFPYDSIEPVPKGIKGADVVQKVNNSTGQCCGTIIWESKRTKGWNEEWVDKLKNDQREVKAEIAVLMSSVLPKEIRNFACYKGVWLTDYACAMGLATAMRMSLIEVAQTKQAIVGQHEKMEVLYNYLCGPEFKQKVEAIVEAFVTMKHDLDNEKRVIEKLWAKREQQIARIIKNTVKMYGDMQGIIGASLPQIKSLELKALTDETES